MLITFYVFSCFIKNFLYTRSSIYENGTPAASRRRWPSFRPPADTENTATSRHPQPPPLAERRLWLTFLKIFFIYSYFF
jgi:hypothetical protein